MSKDLFHKTFSAQETLSNADPLKIRDFLISRAQKVTPIGVGNCIGTGLYIVQEQDMDSYYLVGRAARRLSFLELIKRPTIGALFIWYNGGCVDHLAVVTSISPLLFADRDGDFGRLYVDRTLREIEEPYRKGLWVYTHKGIRVPSILNPANVV